MARRKKVRTYGACQMPGCDNEATFKEAGVCNKCYHWLNYWKDKTPTQRMRRFKTLQFWATRSSAVWSDHGGMQKSTSDLMHPDDVKVRTRNRKKKR